MKPRRVRSRKKNLVGWQFRFTDPVDRSRKKKTFWYAKERKAAKAFAEFMEGRENVAIGLPDTSGWSLTYGELLKKFLDEAPIASLKRRRIVTRDLQKAGELLKLSVASDLAQLGKLTTACQKIAAARPGNGATWVRFFVQQPLKQLTKWAAAAGLIPHNPLQEWKVLEYVAQKRRRSFMPEEIRAILDAAYELDQWLGRKRSSALAFATLLITGNRPSAVLACDVKEFDGERLRLPAGQGKKRNGKATVPPAFAAILKAHAPKAGPLLQNDDGAIRASDKIARQFRAAMILAIVRRLWPEDAPAGVRPVEIVSVILNLEKRKVTDPVKIRQNERPLVALALHFKQDVDRLLKDRDMYALRKTHISWARRLIGKVTTPDSIREQVGHAPRDIEERHYIDLIDASSSSRAVWEVLVGIRSLKTGELTHEAEREALPLLLAAGAESQSGPSVAPIVAPDGNWLNKRTGEASMQGRAQSIVKASGELFNPSQGGNFTQSSNEPALTIPFVNPSRTMDATGQNRRSPVHSAELRPHCGPRRDLWQLIDAYNKAPAHDRQTIVDETLEGLG